MDHARSAETGGSVANRLKVAVATHVYWPSVGGAEIYHAMVSAELSRSAEVLVITSQLSPLPDRGADSSPEPLVQVQRLRSRVVFGEHLLSPVSLIRALHRFDPDVIWGNHPSLTADLAGIFALLTRRPWVASYHGDSSGRRFYARPYTWWCSRLLRHATFVLVHAENYAEVLARRGVPRDRIVAVNPGPGIGRGHPPEIPPTAEAPGNTPGTEHAFLFVGGLDTARQYKQPERLIEAVANLKVEGLKVHLWMVGDGDRRPALERSAAEQGVEGQVRFLGFLSDSELAARYYAAWALVLPSTATEGFGLVTLEAIHYGCPVVTSDSVPAGPILARSGCAIVYSDRTPRGLEDALRRIWESATLRASLSNQAVRTAPAFGWESSAPRLASRILSAAAARGGPGGIHRPMALGSTETGRGPA